MAASAPRAAERRAGFAVLAAFAVVSVLFTGFYPPFTNPNELSRFEAVYAYVESGSFSIDGALRVLGDHEDKARANGHFYSNKAPGLAFAAIPVYAALRMALPAPRSVFDPIFVLTRLATVTLACFCAIALLVRRLRPSPEGPLVAFALVFGTPFLFYGRSFFGHAWTAALLFLAWEMLRRREEEPGRSGALLDAAAGLLAGWAAISEYTAAPLAALLAVRAARRADWRRLSAFAAGASVPLLLLLLYDASCFGSPWVLSSAREANADFARVSRAGLFGFGPPSLDVAGRYLVGPARGLLLRSPFWLWLLPGFVAAWRSRKDRLDGVFALVAIGGYFALLTGYQNWHGGWSLGNRYLLPVLFFAAPSLASALESAWSRGLFSLAAVFSAAIHFALSSTFPYVPVGVRYPAASASLWFLRHGWVAPNAFAAPGRVVIVGGLACVAAAATFALAAARPGSPRAALAAAGGLVLFGVALAASPGPSYGARLFRAAVYGAYSGLDPERRELERTVLEAATEREKREALSAWRQFGRRR